jgi:hypothetical protein
MRPVALEGRLSSLPEIDGGVDLQVNEIVARPLRAFLLFEMCLVFMRVDAR